MFEIDGRGDLDGAGNGTGCDDPGEVEAAVIADVGPVNTTANELAPPSDVFGELDFWELWSAQNPVVGDYHGVYAYPEMPYVDLSWHFYDGEGTIVDATDCGQDPEQMRAVPIIEGLNTLQVNMTLARFGLLQPQGLVPRGAATVVQPPIRIGPARSTFSPPLFTPEPGNALAAFAATGALALLARRKR